MTAVEWPKTCPDCGARITYVLVTREDKDANWGHIGAFRTQAAATEYAHLHFPDSENFVAPVHPAQRGHRTQQSHRSHLKLVPTGPTGSPRRPQ